MSEITYEDSFERLERLMKEHKALCNQSEVVFVAHKDAIEMKNIERSDALAKRHHAIAAEATKIYEEAMVLLAAIKAEAE